MKNYYILFILMISASICFAQTHNHDHGNHEGHNHATQTKQQDNHQGHDHSGHNHDGHNHADHAQPKAQQKSKHTSHAGHDHSGHGHDHGAHASGGDHGAHHVNNIVADCGSAAQPVHHTGYDPAATAIHHISDANVYTILDKIRIPLPAIIYNKDRGIEFFSTGKFGAGHHDDGHHGYKDYVLYQGNIHRITCPGYTNNTGLFDVQGFDKTVEKGADGKEIEKRFAIIDGKAYHIEQKTIWDGGLLGGGMTSFYDLSPTKNVVSMFLVCALLFFVFRKVAKSYVTREGMAPSGLQSFVEPVFQFIRDDVAIPFIKDDYEKYLPFLMTVFFFILGLNLWGQVPFLGSTNVTGNLTVTAVLAIIVFIITNINGNADYWKHVFNMPGVPWFVKIILTPVELLGLFIKPLTLMLRLAGNIMAGHIAILSFIGLIFIFGKAGESMIGSVTGTALAIPLTIFMMAIELIVAFIQAFVFTLLAASYIGAATEKHAEHH